MSRLTMASSSDIDPKVYALEPTNSKNMAAVEHFDPAEQSGMLAEIQDMICSYSVLNF